MTIKRFTKLLIFAQILFFGVGSPVSVLGQPASKPTSIGTSTLADNSKIIQAHIKILKSATNPLETRKIAAGLLMDLDVPGAKELLLKILSDKTDKQARLAVIEAIADREEPSSDYINPLKELLLGNDPEIQKATASALGRFWNKNLTEELIRIAEDEKGAIGQRLAAIEALGKMRSKTTVETLIRLMENAPKNQEDRKEIETACGKSLEEITRAELGTNLKAWKNWWDINRTKTPVQWLQSQLDVATNENREYKKRLEQTEDELIKTFGQLFQISGGNDAQKIKLLQSYLTGTLPVQRRAGLEIIKSYLSPKQTIPPELAPTIRGLIDDKDPTVRRECVKVLGLSNDKDSLSLLVQQLDLETDSMVKQSILATIGQLGDQSILEKLLGQLNSQIEPVSIGATRGISKVFQSEKKISGSLRNQVIQAILNRYRQTPSEQIQLKQELLLTMSAIEDSRFVTILKQELAGDNPDLRLYAARGLSSLGGEEIVQTLINHLNDSEAGVRAEIASGIASLNSDPKTVDALISRINPNIEKDNQVRQATWNAILTMIKRWPIDQQLNWARSLRLGDDAFATEHLTTLIDLITGEISEQSAGWPAEQKISIMTEFGKFLLSTNRADESVKYFRQAISASKQLTPEKPIERADELLNLLLSRPNSDGIIAQYFINVNGLLDQSQIQSMIDRFLLWADRAGNRNSAGRICKQFTSDFLANLSEESRAKVRELTAKGTD
jgi:HEAT repeat protein